MQKIIYMNIRIYECVHMTPPVENDRRPPTVEIKSHTPTVEINEIIL